MKEREIALFILMDIFDEGAYNNIILRKTLSAHEELTSVQRAFITELVNGTLRNLINIDYVINQFSKTKTDKMKPFILNNIRIGVYQILYMDKIPVSAACNEAVILAKKRSFSTLSGFVNGVLRAIARNKDNIKYPDDRLKALTLKYSYPEWLIKYWLEEMSFDEAEKVCSSFAMPPRISVCVNTVKTDKKTLKNKFFEEGIAVDSDSLLDNSLYIYRTNNISESRCYKEGLFHIMDESSMLAVKALAPEPYSVVVDVCSAPGGKSFAIAEYMNNTGRVYSRDIYEHKLELIKSGAERLGLSSITPQLRNGTEEDKETKADYVIVDAPCSGFGLVRKKPDIKYNRVYEDIKELAEIQRDILSAASAIVKDNGVLVYSTCTISHIENIDNVRWFCREHGFKLESLTPYIPKNISIKTAEEGYIQLLPQQYGTDGFFIARMRKNG